MDAGLTFPDNHLLPKPDIHANVAALIDPAAGAVHIGQPDRYRPDPSREPAQREVDAPSHVVVQVCGKFDSPRH
jgi:hypothetical protein